MVDQLWTLPDVSKFWAENKPENEAYIFCNKYGRSTILLAKDVYLLAGRFASQLRRNGFDNGDVVANGLPNCPERVITDLGIVMAGCITMNMQILEKDGRDFWNTADISQCRGAIFQDKSDSMFYQLFSQYFPNNNNNNNKDINNADSTNGQRYDSFRDMSIPFATTLRKAILIGRTAETEGELDMTSTSDKGDKTAGTLDLTKMSFLQNLLTTEKDIFKAECSPSDNAYIFCTSGSTGFCKLVSRSHKKLLEMSRRFKGMSKSKVFNDRILGWLGGFPFDYYSPCAPRLLQDAFVDHYGVGTKDLWVLIEREQCEGAVLAPGVIDNLVEEFKDRPPEFRLKHISTAGEAIKKNTVRALGLLADTIFIAYASTETSAIAATVVTNAAEYRDFTCGRPIPGTQVRVVDENLQDVPPETEGDVLVKGPNVFTHYYNSKESALTPDGWFMIQDRGVFDDAGMLYVSCRQGDVIAQGHMLIYLSWPESILSRCPDVVKVNVIGVKNSAGEDKICACVEPRKNSGLTEDGLLEFYNSQLDASSNTAQYRFKPELTYIMFYYALPYNSIGKIDKKTMKANAVEKFGLAEK